MNANKLPARAEAPGAIACHTTVASRYRERAAYIRAVADAFAQDTPRNRTTDLIVDALRTAADDAEGMAGTLDADERRIA